MKPSSRPNLVSGKDAEPRKDIGAVTVPKGMSGLGVCSVVCGLLGFLFPLTTFFGIGIAVKGIARDRSDLLCCIGLFLSLAMLVYNIIDMCRACSSGSMSALFGA